MVTSQSSTCGFTAITLAAGLAFLLPDNGALAGSPGYDGVYKGQVTLTRGEAGFCGRSPIGVTKQVVNGQFSLVYDQSHNIGINLEVQPDGSFSGSQQYVPVGARQQSRISASGHIAGNVLDAHIEGDACARDYHLTKG
jgi:hypothetical protein